MTDYNKIKRMSETELKDYINRSDALLRNEHMPESLAKDISREKKLFEKQLKKIYSQFESSTSEDKK